MITASGKQGRCSDMSNDNKSENLNNAPDLTLIIPTYNCEAFLSETLGSVLPELPDSCELIVVDDGSDDDTPRMLEAYANSCKDRGNIRIAYRPHGGASAARNAGLDLAHGRYIAFMDCDDLLREGFFEESLRLIDSDADMYIFGFERVDKAWEPGSEEISYSRLKSRAYESASEFADEYIRTRALLVYSACNKFYKRSIVEDNKIRFKEGLVFGEDRLFNYDYIPCCKGIETSEILMFRYMQRSDKSATTRYMPDYFKTALMLHQAKMNCFLPLAADASEDEKDEFERYDIMTEIRRAKERFEAHPEEAEESLPLIEKVLEELD